MGKRLDGKVAIVSGSGRGIGKAIARIFAHEGARVVVADIDTETGKRTAEEIEQANGQAFFVASDMSRKTDVDDLARAALTRYGRIDILCHNAGIYPRARLEDMAEADWDKVCAVNLKSAFLAIKACLPQMKRQAYGRIVITSSITGPRTVIPGLAHYAATKAGLNGLIRTAAVEFARYNITVNGIEPGTILSDGMREKGEAYIQSVAQSIPMGKLGEPEDIAYAMLFLASDEAKYITGQTIIVDGGQILPETKLAIS